jgi:mannose-6-phosphate isomerase
VLTGPEGAAARLLDWHRIRALPLWGGVGYDAAAGVFAERLDENGRDDRAPTRARVQARQIYVFAEAARRGWDGAAAERALRGAETLLRRYQREDGGFRHAVGRDGTPVDETPYLYDQAFALFALGHVRGLPGAPAGIDAAAERLLRHLETARAHGAGGYVEIEAGRPAFLANPHMHLLEAALAWVETGADGPWRDLADALVTLCLRAFVDPATGALREVFAADWSPDAGPSGRLVEPGHHYEWAWLLDRHAAATGDARAAATVAGLLAFADRHGTIGNVTVGFVRDDGLLVDRSTRIWPQTERLKAMARLAPPERRAAAMDAAAAALAPMLGHPTPGAWWDRVDAAGRPVRASAPASSLYHLAGAAAEAETAMRAAAAA